MRCFLYLILALFSSLSLGGTIDPSTTPDKYIEYGKKFKCVARLSGKDKEDNLFCASAVIFKPNWFLTAAHVVKGSKNCYITVEENSRICVEQVYFHKDFHDNKFGYNDIALGYVKDDMGLDFYPELYEENNEIGKICAISGYGMTGTFLTGVQTSDYNRRAGSNFISHIDRHLLITNPSRRSNLQRPFNDNFTQLEFLIGSGDSGGGLFIDKKLAGINSCVIAEDGKPNSTYTDEGGHTRISLYIDWINKTIAGENDAK
jgi:hypothetical protein